MVSQQKNLLTEKTGNTLVITLHRPEALNALNTAMLSELKAVFDEVYDNPSIRGVVITGSGGKAFAAGADIREIAELNELNARKFAETGQELFNYIEECPKPVIAAIHGFALGGGCELAMACHLRVATIHARFGQPEVNLGLIPGYGGTQRLAQLVGKGKALELMMTADLIAAEDALKIGMVNHVLGSPEEMMQKCHEILNKIAEKAPLAISMVIDCVNTFYHSDENGYQKEANSFQRCAGTGDFKEGTNAFIEKRKPVFEGK
ncbi:MAG: enoyl-CoA hydratase-related protein [Cyclobacteriaceae bacterium]|nr:enoyl-CoA hydratase-related protein [Cyclobacteriaceae bacterium]